MKKVLSIAMSIAIMLTLILETFAVSIDEKTDTAEATENSTADLVAYNGTIEELPDYIEDSFNENEKAESIDIYDEDPFSFTTNNTDGTKTIEIFQTPIKYVEDKEIKFIDTKLEELSVLDKLSSDYIYECTKAPVKSFFPTHIRDGVSITNDDYEIKCYPNIESKKLKLKDIFSKKVFSEPTLDEENVLTYEDVFDDNDIITYTPISTGVKEEIIIEEYKGNNVYEFTVELKDLEPLYLTGNSIPLIDKSTGEEVAAISQIDMRDSSQGEAFNTSLFNEIELTQIDGDIYNLKIILDEEFLTSETTVYPVIVDPTLTFNSDPIYDTPVFSGYPDTNFHSNTYNVVGYHGSTYGEAITFIKINNIQNYVYINPKNITSAYLKIYEGSGKTSSATVEVHNVKATWDSKKLTYNTMPALREEVSTSKTISSSGWYQFKITNYIKNWLNKALQDGGQSQNRGLTLKMSTTGVSSRHFCSANHSTYPPSIIINYKEDMSLRSGNYLIQSKHSSLYLDTHAKANGNVMQYHFLASDNQIWYVENLNNGYYTLQPRYYDYTKSLGVASTSTTNGTNVTVYDNDSGNRLKFRIIKNADDSYRILSACNTKIYGLDVTGASLNDLANIQTWEYTGVPQQRWIFSRFLPYWQSDKSKISYMNNTNLKICVEKSSGFGKSVNDIKNYVNYAVNAWSDIGVTHTFTTSNSDCDIYIKGVTRVEAIELGLGETADACAAIMNLDYSKTGPNYVSQGYNPRQKWVDIYESDKRIIYLIWDNKDDGYNDKNSDFPDAKWKAVTAHEFGHAFGFEASHNTVETLMYPNLNASYPIYTTPTLAEINHLKQIYGAEKY